MHTTRLPAIALFAVVAVAASLIPVPADALVRTAPVEKTVKVDRTKVTWGKYREKKIYVTGTWTPAEAEDSLTFTRGAETVVAVTITKEDCAYQKIRARAAKSWKVDRLEQKQAKIETVVLGRSDYKGFKWSQPGASSGSGSIAIHWCLAQDAKSAVELTVDSSDAAFLTFAKQNLIRQFAVRRAAR